MFSADSRRKGVFVRHKPKKSRSDKERPASTPAHTRSRSPSRRYSGFEGYNRLNAFSPDDLVQPKYRRSATLTQYEHTRNATSISGHSKQTTESSSYLDSRYTSSVDTVDPGGAVSARRRDSNQTPQRDPRKTPSHDSQDRDRRDSVIERRTPNEHGEGNERSTGRSVRPTAVRCSKPRSNRAQTMPDSTGYDTSKYPLTRPLVRELAEQLPA